MTTPKPGQPDPVLKVLVFGASLRADSLNGSLAALASRVAEQNGATVDHASMRDFDVPSYDGDVVHGSIVAIDRFGNAITDIERARIPFERFALRVRDAVIDRIERTYGGAAPGAFLITGSSGCIEISVANASAAERLHLRRLERVEVWAAESSGP